ncbi:hypothetical protein EOD42_06585 [Rhodovarius crocodyli]|uniref:Glycosyltransferase subfamily 4-like N-terminal domain-containing protein n=1 Tax=Rhodovarius crocodyli TaxID=1979269 RepID=A0A437MIM3_9PROT|nr:glycosyltransferase family 4 protein [Rhodovarius crocodyli]RVT97489.1 hypothetical protein EOD42_06585 [Rhodovarius crocodyli]
MNPHLPRAGFGVRALPPGLHAVVVSWHLAPEPAWQAGAEPLLGFWAEPLLDALAEAGARVTLLLPLAGEVPAGNTTLGRLLAARGIGLAFAPGFTPAAVDAALEALSPDIVHAPEREGLLVAALSRRAAGLAHGRTAVLLHARGPQGFRHREEARFTPSAEALVTAAWERQAMCLADLIVCASPEVADWWAAEGRPVRRVAPLAWRPHPVPKAPPSELVLPLPMASEAGLEFALFTAARAGARLALPLILAGVPGPMVLGSAAQAVAALSGRGVDWRMENAATPQAACARLLRPGVVALLPALHGTPPELYAFCAMAGVPVLTTPHGVAREAAARWPGRIHAWERQERPFAAMLARLPELPPALEAPPQPAWPEVPMHLPPPAPAEVAAGRWLAHGGRLEAPEQAALLRLAAASGAAACSWGGTGGGEDLAAVMPERMTGSTVMLDAARLPESAAVIGTPGFLATLAREAGEVFALHVPVRAAVVSATPADPAMLGPYDGIGALARHFAMLEQEPREWRDGEIRRAMAGTRSDSPEYLKLLAMLAEVQGQPQLARQAWQAAILRLPEDQEAQEQVVLYRLRGEGRLGDTAALRQLLQENGEAEGRHLPREALRHAMALRLSGRGAEAEALLAEIAAAFPAPAEEAP